MDGKRYRTCQTLVLQFLVVSLTGCMGLPKHCPVPLVEPPTVLVSGMVKTPGKLLIPNSGLTLRDALALTGGDISATSFNIPSIYMLVSLERPDATYNFSLPLVTGADAGKIFLQAGDKVIVQPWYYTDLAHSIDGGGKCGAWRSRVHAPIARKHRATLRFGSQRQKSRFQDSGLVFRHQCTGSQNQF